MVRSPGQSQFGNSSLCIGETPLSSAAPHKIVSANAFADGANQNCGNMLTGRSTTRVAQPPGGASSLCLGGDPQPPSGGRGDAGRRSLRSDHVNRAQVANDFGGGDQSVSSTSRCAASRDQEVAPRAPPEDPGHRGASRGESDAWGYPGHHPDCRRGGTRFHPGDCDGRARAAATNDAKARSGLEDGRGQLLRDSHEESRHPASGLDLSFDRARSAAENDASFSNRSAVVPQAGTEPAKLQQRHAELCARGQRRRAFPEKFGASSIVFG